jgi:uncharacterized protein (TIGR00255 family)
MGKPISMTGFGRGEASGNGRSWTVELRAVNHRYSDIIIKIPRQYYVLEDKIKKEIVKYHTRGRVDLYISVVDEAIAIDRLKADVGLAREYCNCLKEISQELSVAGEPDLSMLATFRDIIVPVDNEAGVEVVEQLWPDVKRAVIAALDDCLAMRQNEGEALLNDLQSRIGVFEKTVDDIDNSIPEILEKRQQALKERLDNLLSGVDIDPLRLAQEVAVMADKSDVSEEIVRLRSHISQFHGFLELEEPVGRRLDFLIQEFLREVNTIASKINNADTAHLIVGLKNELEKIREQVQNIE